MITGAGSSGSLPELSNGGSMVSSWRAVRFGQQPATVLLTEPAASRLNHRHGLERQLFGRERSPFVDGENIRLGIGRTSASRQRIVPKSTH